DLGVRALQNTGKGLIYSGGDAAIGGALGADRIASGIAGRIDNISSVIDVSGNLSIDAQVVNNIRENVAIAPTQVKTIDTTVNMMVAAWQKNSKNTAGTVSDTSNYKAWEFYYIAPEDVLQDEPYIAPDGTRLGKAVVRLTANTSRFFFGSGGLGYDVRGERWRMDPVTGTVTIYYVSKGTAANPDQVSGGDPFDVLKSKEKFTYQNDRLTFSSAYGTCSTTCIQFITPASLSNPDATIVGRRQHTQEHGLNEEKRVAHHVAHEDQLQPGAGADAVIRSGGNMRLSVDELNNRYAQIAAGGNLQIVGHGADSRVSNVGLELFRTHTFNNTSIAYDGTRTQWTAEPISEKIGQLGGQITANGTLSIDVGDLSNLNQGRNAPNVQNGSAMANLNVQRPKALPDGSGHGSAQ
ncbi:hypothetical protein ACOZB2_32580, partial [Pantoea endophytica]